jgi:energy-coupling factor transport system permease protein
MTTPLEQKQHRRPATLTDHHPQQQTLSVDSNPSTFGPSDVGTFGRFHSLVWLVWLVAAVLAVSSNPLLNMLVLAQAVVVALSCHTESSVGHALGLFARLAVLLVVVRTVLSAVPVGGITYGATPLFTTPTLQLPLWLGGLNLGGVATLEMIAGGFVQGLKLATLVLIFGAFNAVADHYGLLRRTPRALFHVGLAVTIGLTFAPHVVLQLGAIRDAQRVRGHRFRAWRDALPLIVPLLAGGLERSIQLAEAMDSRGYGRTVGPRHSSLPAQLLAIAGITVLSVGLYFGFTGDGRGFGASVLGMLITVAALHALGGGAPRTRYVRERWHRRDTLVVLACSLVIVGMSVLRLSSANGLTYTTLPRITLPPFAPAAGGLILLLGAPAWLALFATEEPYGRRSQSRTLDRRTQRRGVGRAYFQGAAQPEPPARHRAPR